jgi:hypothetical protein
MVSDFRVFPVGIVSLPTLFNEEYVFVNLYSRREKFNDNSVSRSFLLHSPPTFSTFSGFAEGHVKGAIVLPLGKYLPEIGH